ncbi:hypothetical protein EJE24_06340 [Enterobacter huaxiensis]|uniref:Uncharacterized protein n=1 Tax=Enterobacter huaxiensis TaxID=2494702 RepID=A0A428LVM1_9ENTR|nr:hypothetical protein [Enterobacter huaxiensis]RSK69409.1 hypothetical protein EJE24_06340 [Enterobacter huaxiensis]
MRAKKYDLKFIHYEIDRQGGNLSDTKLKKAIQMTNIWGKIWGQIEIGGIIWGDKMANIV